MGKCDTCGTFILFGGVHWEGMRFCSTGCQRRATDARFVEQTVFPEEITAHLNEVHAGPCPRCGGPGPIDLHPSHTIYSVVVVSFWQDHQHLCCRRCAFWCQARAAGLCLVAGWWSFYGFVLTPIQVGRNLLRIVWPPDATQPSAELRRLVMRELAGRLRGEP